jgi:hypothetical protein
MSTIRNARKQAHEAIENAAERRDGEVPYAVVEAAQEHAMGKDDPLLYLAVSLKEAKYAEERTDQGSDLCEQTRTARRELRAAVRERAETLLQRGEVLADRSEVEA